jgi:hypothetical protein
MDHHETIWMLESPKHDQESIKIYAGVHVSGGFPTRSACTPQDAGSLACSNGGCNGGSTGVNMMSYQILLRFPSCNRDAVRWTLYCYQRAISRVWVEACQRLARRANYGEGGDVKAAATGWDTSHFASGFT